MVREIRKSIEVGKNRIFMKVICKENRAENLDFEAEIFTFPKTTVFPLTKGKEYIVMGMMIGKESNCIYYLLDDYSFPDWAPYVLFDISDNELSPHWFVSILNKKESTGNIFYLAGFSELCNDDDYHDALFERERYALDIYFKRKHEVQEWYFEKG